MGHLGERARSRILREQFREMGIAVLESAATWSISPRSIERISRVRGVHNVEAALARGKGVLIVAGHFIPLDMAMQLASYRVPAHAVYRPHKNPVIDFVTLRGRSRQGARMFSREDMRTPLAALRNNEAVWFSPDQDHGLAQGAFVEFFSRPAATVTTTARLAGRTGASLVPLLYRRLPGLGGYEIEFGAPLGDFPGDDLVQATRRINHFIEQQAYLMPAQYLWLHRRFKTRPPGMGAIYE
jgi:KDO2-lipid IV(A) lauroyltransferase